MTFERRIEDVMTKAMLNDDLKPIPDLIIFGSLYWDEAFLSEVSQRRRRIVHKLSKEEEEGSLLYSRKANLCSFTT